MNVLESNFSVLKQFILEYKTVEAMRDKATDETEKTVFLHSFEKNSPEYYSMVSCSFYVIDVENVPRRQNSETLNEVFIHGSPECQSLQNAMNAEAATKPCPAVE